LLFSLVDVVPPNMHDIPMQELAGRDETAQGDDTEPFFTGSIRRYVHLISL
jgi:hypothetical protein